MAEPINHALRQYIEENILPRYDGFDKAHQRDHVLMVIGQSQEIAEQLAFNLYQHLPFAAEKAYQWIASDKEYDQLCGFHVLSRLFMNGQEPNERGINEYLDEALCALQGPFPSVRKAALQSLQRFAELGLMYERLAKSATKSIDLDIF